MTNKRNSASETKKEFGLFSPATQDTPLSQAIAFCLSAQWSSLLDLDEDVFFDSEEKAKLDLLKALADFRLGNFAAARSKIEIAFSNGFTEQVVGELLVAAMQGTVGCVEICVGDDVAARASFLEAVRPFEARVVNLDLTARHQQICESIRMGLFTMSQQMLLSDHSELEKSAEFSSANLAVIRSQIEMLGYELSLAFRRGRDMSADAPETVSESNFKQRSCSQIGQDLWVLEKTGLKRGGFFVEFGATDGVRLSNTFLLESEFEWQGICAEPNPVLFEKLQQNRKCTTVSDCIGGQSGVDVEFVLADEFGGIADYAFADQHSERRSAFKATGQVMQTTTISLDEFLKKYDAPRTIDYLSIDTEGSEYEILKFFPFDEWQIRFLTVEHNWTPHRDKISDLLRGFGYIRTEAEFDDWYELIDS